MVTFDNTLLNYGLSLIIFNILVYIYLSIGIFFILLILSDKSYSMLNKFKNLNESYTLLIGLLLLLLSLAGIPPLFGFVGKFLLYIQLLAYKSFYMFILFLIFNVFILYFYIQNIRFMVSKTPNKIRISKYTMHFQYDFSLAIILCIFFFNIFGIFFFENFLNYIVFILSF